ncbi:MAG: hypothetical protein RMI83_03350 [Desulfurococcaceae archaeon]|nr:hypothetical protein [Sulfolobales archaeon]MDW8170123.1 hypothetical protein [Desulfurococcaceae archaeon]
MRELRNRVVSTIRNDKDFRSSYVTRLILNLMTKEVGGMKICFWDSASSATLTWIFLNDV